MTDELPYVHVGEWGVYIFLSWLTIHFSGCHSDWIGKSWWGKNGESRIPGLPGPQTPWLLLVIVYNFCVLAPFPHAVFLSLKPMWEEENAEHSCIVSSPVPAMLYIDTSCYYIYKYIYNFVCFLHLRSSRILYFFSLLSELLSLLVSLNPQAWVNNESGFRKE